MYTFLIVIHIIACLVLIAVILLQAGRGGGLSEALGGGTPQTIFGTKTTTFMTRATTICAIVFLLTCLSLGILSIRRGRSLMEMEAARQRKADLERAIPFREELPVEEEMPAESQMPVEEGLPLSEEQPLQ